MAPTMRTASITPSSTWPVWMCLKHWASYKECTVASPSRMSPLACSRHQGAQTGGQAVCFLVVSSCVSRYLLQKDEPGVCGAKVARPFFCQQGCLVCSRHTLLAAAVGWYDEEDRPLPRCTKPLSPMPCSVHVPAFTSCRLVLCASEQATGWQSY